MKKKYDFVFLTNTPSFYKINLCNQIAITHSILLVFYGYGAEAVNTRLDSNVDYQFDYVFLHKGNAACRNKFMTFFRLLFLMKNTQFKKILYSGWFVPEYNFMAFFIPKYKNCLVCESSSFESHFNGIKGWVKKCIISQMGTVLPSGEPQKRIFEEIGYKGQISITGGVGIFRKQPRSLSVDVVKRNKKYVYVGRLIECKNLKFLVKTFNDLGKPLTIVGKGELEDELKAMAKSNITFLGFIDNEKLKSIYQAHDVFILPSKSEPWGLVVEEALYWGLPVIVSDRVGSYIDMVEKLHTGCIFHYNSEKELYHAIETVESNYESYRNNVLRVDFDERDKKQVTAYTKLLQ